MRSANAWLRLSPNDLIALTVFALAISIANIAGDAPWPVWVSTLFGSLVLGGWQIRQANTSEFAARDRIQAELSNRNRQLCEANIVEGLRQAARVMAPGDPTARANIMLIGDDNRLFIAYHFNMADAPDHAVRFDKYQGCAGHAWAMAEQASADLEDVSDTELRRVWKLTRDQVAVTRGVRSMTCTPIRDPRAQDDVIGVFCIDSERRFADTFFADRGTLDEALVVSEMVGRLLVAGGII